MHGLVRTVALAIAVVLAVALSQPQLAEASPAPVPQPLKQAPLMQGQPPTYHWYWRHASATEWKYIKLARATHDANDSGTLNYRIAKRKFGSHVSWRRQYAAGWKIAGGRISHISSAELSKVKAVMNKYRRTAASFSVQPMATNCHGVTKKTGTSPWKYYLNSCDTNKLYEYLGLCGIAGGLVARFVPRVGTVIGPLMIAACGAIGLQIVTAQNNSTLHAIIIEVKDMGTYYGDGGGEQVEVKVVPQ